MTQDRIWCVPTSGAFVNTRVYFSPRSFTFFFFCHRSKEKHRRPPLRAPKKLYFVSRGYFNKLFLECLIISRPKVWSIFSLCGLTSCSLIITELSSWFVISLVWLSNAVSECCENTTCFTLIMKTSGMDTWSGHVCVCLKYVFVYFCMFAHKTGPFSQTTLEIKLIPSWWHKFSSVK